MSNNSIIQNPPLWETTLPRWEHPLNTNDSKTIWKTINWKGDLERKNDNEHSSTEFKIHFENLLNPPNVPSVNEIEFSDCPYIPVLDDPISTYELNSCIKGIISNKASDINGISPGLFKLLYTSWLQFILVIFNVIFLCVKAPSYWTISKLIVLFKKGKRCLCGNYRGISIKARRGSILI